MRMTLLRSKRQWAGVGNPLGEKITGVRKPDHNGSSVYKAEMKRKEEVWPRAEKPA